MRDPLNDSKLCAEIAVANITDEYIISGELSQEEVETIIAAFAKELREEYEYHDKERKNRKRKTPTRIHNT